MEPSIVLTSDASGSWGCGAYWGSQCFQLPWSVTACHIDINIATKELIPIVIAAALWGKMWSGQVVCSRCDNEAVVAVINRCTSRDYASVMVSHFFEASFLFQIVATHMAGSENTLADNLSRDKLHVYLRFLVSYSPYFSNWSICSTSAIARYASQPQARLDIASLERSV